ncbi:MAG: hypothetical protein GH155_06100 [Spirochaeta sp.]|nr:hypothetical protein [Spirochaeta sp.]
MDYENFWTLVYDVQMKRMLSQSILIGRFDLYRSTSKEVTKHMSSNLRPELKLLGTETIKKVITEAKEVLEELGFYIENRQAIELLQQVGVRIDLEKKRAYLSPDLIDKALESVPSTIPLFNRAGHEVVELGGDNVCFDPGSAALNVLDPETGETRNAVTMDFIHLGRELMRILSSEFIV